MSDKHDQEIGEERRLQLAAAIKKHLHTHGLSRKSLIRNDLSESTIDKALAGTKLSQATIDKIEAILKTKFEHDLKLNLNGNIQISNDKAPDSLGNYTFSAVEHIQGDYLFIRPSFKNPSIISAYMIEVKWEEIEHCLVFAERGRSDAKYAQSGKVYVPFGRPFLNFLTIATGGVRLIVASMPDSDGVMRGIVTTIHNPSGTNYVPASSPVAMVRTAQVADEQLGQITHESQNYARYKSLLDEVVAEQFGIMVSGVEFIDRRRGLAVVS